MSDVPDNPKPENVTELVARFRSELESGRVATVIDFVAGLGGELDIDRLAALVSCEITYRKNQGQAVSVDSYYEQFPDLRAYFSEQTITRDVIHETTAATELVEGPNQATAASSSTRAIVVAGDKLDDFELIAELGKGSFATVFLARQISMQRLVALKVSGDHGTEAQTLAQLTHPNIVGVFDQRRESTYGLHLLYMQYLEGGTLLDVLREVLNLPEENLCGRLFVECVDQAITASGGSPSFESMIRKEFENASWEQTICRIGYSLANALAYAHGKGVLHRDIKPANVLVGSDCVVKLADFNISSAETVIGESKFGGSLAYMSPEQIRAFNRDDEFSSEQLNEKADLYSLGVMLYHMLMRELPFYATTKSRSNDGLDNMRAERENSMERIDVTLKSKPPLLRNALIRCLQPDPDKRPSSATDLANQFKLGLDSEAESFLFPPPSNWTLSLRQWFLPVCIVVNLLFNALAAAFVFNFNLADSIPPDSTQTFSIIMMVVNGIVFPAAIVTFIYLTRTVPAGLKLSKQFKHDQIDDIRTVMNQTLLSGHIQAVICAALWLLAGFIYPVTLRLCGVPLELSTWVAFIASHWLAGISITALTFFATSYLALKIWLPVLIEGSYRDAVIISVKESLNSLVNKIPIYQFLAVCVPLFAMSLLVVLDELVTDSKFPLTVISLFGLLTIPVVMFGGNRIRAICERLLIVFRKG
jgi:serine/threonine protein kinase